MRLGRLLPIALVSALPSCDASFGMPRAATEQGSDTFELWQTYMWAGVVVAAIVYGLIVWSLVRYRARRRDADDAIGRGTTEHLPIEVTYTVIPIALATVLFVLSTTTQARVDAVPDDPDVTVAVEAFSWGWHFTYEGAGVEVVSPPSSATFRTPEIVLPLDRTVKFELTSSDVIHAFWVPGFLFKRDAIPGHVNEFAVTPTETGTFAGVCSEFCGLNHAFMRFQVRVVPAAEFEAWIAGQRAAEGSA